MALGCYGVHNYHSRDNEIVQFDVLEFAYDKYIRITVLPTCSGCNAILLLVWPTCSIRFVDGPAYAVS